MGLCSGHGNSVVIRESSLYSQSLLAKLAVYRTQRLKKANCYGMAGKSASSGSDKHHSALCTARLDLSPGDFLSTMLSIVVVSAH